MAVDEINASGGLLGRPIELIFYDAQSNNQLYGRMPILHGLDLSVGDGEYIGILGHKGTRMPTGARLIASERVMEISAALDMA